ncbi:CpsD/CapB family tyrosine-protein kinase [Lactobacillus sp. ESL0791]|uniref:CpsD/CapB family tyrosine-protein kinase n=1 Tax=Lactobacillus sp. ESL0791 TaxID=2983234 RepID=UPI0023F636DA|nr:CpsD/CapB family tyrosine-protein kinase [Lactobacillus sp. ESL0791]MDF7639828.1 CpsD/CapB family tyrosine-protein kinase [Lactobacillus sp. ESL0791]
MRFNYHKDMYEYVSSQKNKQFTSSIKNGVNLITNADPKNVVSEQFRTLRTNINFSAVNHELKTILITSPEVNEGKSTISANLAVTWAQQGQKVLFIDADLRQPTIQNTFGLFNRKGGLSTILSSTKDFDSVVQRSLVNNLAIITSGPTPPNPAELLASKRMENLLASFRKKYDLVVLDVPPVLPVTDTQVISAKADGVVLVVRQGQTQKAAVKRSLELLKMVKANLLGYVLNDVTPKNVLGYGYGYGYSYSQDT